jgi:uncharacterized protein (DUF983 family)
VDSCRSWQSAVPPVFSMAIVVWAVVFLQFWRRTNAEILTRFATAELWNSHLQIVVPFFLVLFLHLLWAIIFRLLVALQTICAINKIDKLKPNVMCILFKNSNIWFM